jgi:hypothetical protein
MIPLQRGSDLDALKNKELRIKNYYSYLKN